MQRRLRRCRRLLKRFFLEMLKPYDALLLDELSAWDSLADCEVNRCDGAFQIARRGHASQARAAASTVSKTGTAGLWCKSKTLSRVANPIVQTSTKAP